MFPQEKKRKEKRFMRSPVGDNVFCHILIDLIEMKNNLLTCKLLHLPEKSSSFSISINIKQRRHHVIHNYLQSTIHKCAINMEQC